MSDIDSTNRATAVGVGNKNLIFAIGGGNLRRKINVVATYDPLKTDVVPNVPVQMLSGADAGNRFAFGQPLHKLVDEAFQGSKGVVEIWATPQEESGGAVASVGDITWVGTTTKAGIIYLRIAGKLYQITIPSGSEPEGISDAIVAFVNNFADVQVTLTTTAVTFETVFTAKGKGPEGDNITISLNALDGEEFPPGIVSGTIQAMGVVTPGVGVPDIDEALTGMGTEDDANELRFTHLVHGYGLDTQTIDKISAYVGEGNEFVGCYSKLVNRPFVSLNCDTVPGSAGFTALKVITDARLEDRANGIDGAPGESGNPTEMAAWATGRIAAIAQNNPAQHYGDQVWQRDGFSDSEDRWTKNDSTRNLAIAAGISPSRVISGTLYIQNVITFYRPPSVEIASNAFSSFRSIAVITDVGARLQQTFASEKWRGISIVKDKSKVTDTEAKKKARDILDVQTELNNLIDFFVGKSWAFDGDFAKANSVITIRELGNGFDIAFNWQLSGEAQVYNIQSGFDTNIAA